MITTGKLAASDVDTQTATRPQTRTNLRLLTKQPVELPDPATANVAVVGLGYVGLPLVCGFANASHTIGLDIDQEKIQELNTNFDRTGEVNGTDLAQADAQFTTEPEALNGADVILVCVPTPVDNRNRPDYGPLLAATRSVAQHMKEGAVIVYESTVDPGTTEEKCLPLLEELSGLKEGVDFYLGYSPERINPADPSRKLSDIKKIVAGTSPLITEFLVQLYSRVVRAGLFSAASIKVAEAAKILENAQRDVNIALMNELMALYDKMGIRASDVIAAASSKWNFHNYRPGLVGGHCIAVDPYYLVDAGRRHGLSMDLVSAGRSVNEQTPYFLAEKLEELLASTGQTITGKRILVLGRSFKEDCPDTRNSKTFKLMDYLWAQGAEVFNFDPVADDDHFEGGRGSTIIDDIFDGEVYDAIVVTLCHTVFRQQLDQQTLTGLAHRHAPLIDMRGLYDNVDIADHFTYWRP